METQVLEDIVHLLQGVDWLYNYPMTQVFTRDIFADMPEEWQRALTDLSLDALNGLPQCITLEHWPTSLKKFLKECQRLSCLSMDLRPQTLFGSSSSHHPQIPQELTLGLTAKKKHEITTLLGVVKKMLELTGSKHILDIGSGKGYIDSCIHRILHAQVCGVEGNRKLMRSAEKHHWKLYGCCRGINFLNWQLSDNADTICRAEQLVSYLTELDPSCSCQAKTQGRTSRVKDANTSDSLGNTDESKSGVVCEGASVNSGDRDSRESVAEGDIHAVCGNAHPESTCILLGLHACADLSPIIIKVFRDCIQASSLLLLSCCYHKMSLHPKTTDKPVNDDQESIPRSNSNSETHAECYSEDDPTQNEEDIVSEGNDFLNFPMSHSLQEIFRQNNFHMSVFGLRLGAQESGQKWRTETLEEHEYHVRNVAYRGVLEAACVEEGFTLQKLRRRCARKSSFGDFSEYKKDILENYEFQSVGLGETTINSFSSAGDILNSDEEKSLKRNTNISTALDLCYDNYKHYFPLIEPLTGLQLALQPVIEMLVQVDRLTYLKECGFSKVWLKKVFDAEVSPRNVALLAVR